MEDYMIKHYIVVDQNNFIIRGYSTAFEEPQTMDICIDENTQRHFELFGETNPELFDKDNIPLYKWNSERVIEITDEDRCLYVKSLPQEVKSRIKNEGVQALFKPANNKNETSSIYIKMKSKMSKLMNLSN